MNTYKYTCNADASSEKMTGFASLEPKSIGTLSGTCGAQFSVAQTVARCFRDSARPEHGASLSTRKGMLSPYLVPSDSPPLAPTMYVRGQATTHFSGLRIN